MDEEMLTGQSVLPDGCLLEVLVSSSHFCSGLKRLNWNHYSAFITPHHQQTGNAKDCPAWDLISAHALVVFFWQQLPSLGAVFWPISCIVPYVLPDWTSWALWRQMLSITPDKLLVSFNSHLGLKRFHRRFNASLLLWSCSQSSFRAIFVASPLLWFPAAALPISPPHTHKHTWIMQALRELHLGDRDAGFFCFFFSPQCCVTLADQSLESFVV